MRVQITHLKAPWPHGAVVGDVLELESIPAWAAGKCHPVGDDVTLTIAVTSDLKAPITEEAQASESLAQAEAQAAEEKAEIQGKGKKHK